MNVERELELIFEEAEKTVTPEQTIYNARCLFRDYEKFILWGCSSLGKKLKYVIENGLGKEVIAFIDSDPSKWGSIVEGIRVFPPGDLKKLKVEKSIIVISSSFWKEIIPTLEQLGFGRLFFDYIVPLVSDDYLFEAIMLKLKPTNDILERWKDHGGYGFFQLAKKNFHLILRTLQMLEDFESKRTYLDILKYRIFYFQLLKPPVSAYQAYFHPSVSPCEEDVIVDGGAYVGDTIIEIAKRGIPYKRIYAFEPDILNFHRLVRTILHSLGSSDRIEIYRAALGRKDGYLKISNTGTPSSFICDSGSVRDIDIVESISLDSFFNKIDEPPTYIKLDIEGFEIEAILGSKSLISEVSPKLAICVYHRPSDLWAIPNLISNINPNYKFYFGHHIPFFFTESVLYCKPRMERIK